MQWKEFLQMEAVKLRLVQAGVDNLPSPSDPERQISISPDNLAKDPEFLEKFVDHEVSMRQIAEKQRQDLAAINDRQTPELKAFVRNEKKAALVRPYIEKLIADRKLKEVFEADRENVINMIAGRAAADHDFPLDDDANEEAAKHASLSPFDRLVSGGNFTFDDKPSVEDSALLAVSKFAHWIE